MAILAIEYSDKLIMVKEIMGCSFLLDIKLDSESQI